MTTLAQYRAALLARPEIVNVSQPFAPDASDQMRLAIGAAVKRRFIAYKRLSDGNIREEVIDVAVLDPGGPGETIVTEGAGTAKEQADPVTIWQDECAAWLTGNAKTREPRIVEWRLSGADEEALTARVMVVLNQGETDAGPFVTTTYFAAKSGDAVLFGPLT